jgi:hypothetical protein
MLRFSLTVIQSERLIIAKLDGWPDLKTRLIPEDFSKAGTSSRWAEVRLSYCTIQGLKAGWRPRCLTGTTKR